jgi:hypothetical protein
VADEQIAALQLCAGAVGGGVGPSIQATPRNNGSRQRGQNIRTAQQNKQNKTNKTKQKQKQKQNKNKTKQNKTKHMVRLSGTRFIFDST